jgi:hypothetical protein
MRRILPLAGSLVVVELPAGYTERRSDGYREPEAVFIIGTAHASLVSAENVQRVIEGPTARIERQRRTRLSNVRLSGS